jgi:hypothetical protein
VAVVIREQELSGMRWLLVEGPREEAFHALGRETRADIEAVQDAMPERAALRRWASTDRGGARLDQVLRATAGAFGAELGELRALAEGAGVDADELLLANLRGDLGVDDGTGCTDLAWRRGTSFVAHNEDGAPALEGRLMLLTLALDGLAPVTVQWYPGFLPSNTFTVTGHGLVWGIDHVQVLRPAASGAGRHFVARALQQVTTLDDAVSFLRTHPSAGGFCYTVGERSSGRVAVVEAAAGAVAAVEPSARGGTLHWHTNHLRHLPASLDSGPATAAVGKLGQYEESVARGRVLEELRPPASEPSAEWFLDVLTGAPLPHGVHRSATGSDPLMTLCTAVADLNADRITVRGRSGAPAVLALSDFARGKHVARL